MSAGADPALEGDFVDFSKRQDRARPSFRLSDQNNEPLVQGGVKRGRGAWDTFDTVLRSQYDVKMSLLAALQAKRVRDEGPGESSFSADYPMRRHATPLARDADGKDTTEQHEDDDTDNEDFGYNTFGLCDVEEKIRRDKHCVADLLETKKLTNLVGQGEEAMHEKQKTMETLEEKARKEHSLTDVEEEMKQKRLLMLEEDRQIRRNSDELGQMIEKLGARVRKEGDVIFSEKKRGAQKKERVPEGEELCSVNQLLQTVERLEGKLREKEGFIADTKDEAAQKNAEILSKNELLRCRDEQIEEKESCIAHAREEVAQKNADIFHKDELIRCKDNQHTRAVARLEGKLKEKEGFITDAKEEVARTNAEILDKDKLIQYRENQHTRTVTRLERKLREMESDIAHARDEVVQKEAEIFQKDELIRRRDDQLRIRDDLIYALQKRLEAATDAMKTLQTSRMAGEESISNLEVGEGTSHDGPGPLSEGTKKPPAGRDAAGVSGSGSAATPGPQPVLSDDVTTSLMSAAGSPPGTPPTPGATSSVIPACYASPTASTPMDVTNVGVKPSARPSSQPIISDGLRALKRSADDEGDIFVRQGKRSNSSGTDACVPRAMGMNVSEEYSPPSKRVSGGLCTPLQATPPPRPIEAWAPSPLGGGRVAQGCGQAAAESSSGAPALSLFTAISASGLDEHFARGQGGMCLEHRSTFAIGTSTKKPARKRRSPPAPAMRAALAFYESLGTPPAQGNGCVAPAAAVTTDAPRPLWTAPVSSINVTPPPRASRISPSPSPSAVAYDTPSADAIETVRSPPKTPSISPPAPVSMHDDAVAGAGTRQVSASSASYGDKSVAASSGACASSWAQPAKVGHLTGSEHAKDGVEHITRKTRELTVGTGSDGD